MHPFPQGLRKRQSASPSREHCPRKTMNDFYSRETIAFYLFKEVCNISVSIQANSVRKLYIFVNCLFLLPHL